MKTQLFPKIVNTAVISKVSLVFALMLLANIGSVAHATTTTNSYPSSSGSATLTRQVITAGDTWVYDLTDSGTLLFKAGAANNAGALVNITGLGAVFTATSSGGGVVIIGSNTSASTASTSGGGALYATNFATINANSVIFISNTAARSGGAIYLNTNATLNAQGAQFTKNVSTLSGGAIYSVSSIQVNVTNGLFASNSVTVSTNGNGGGAAYISGGISDFSSSTFTNNQQQGSASSSIGGGALYINGGTATMASATFFGNTATSNGGAIYGTTNGLINVNNAKFTNNAAGISGGALYLSSATTVSMISTLFSSNSVTAATASYGGGAVYISGGVSDFTSSTFVNNAQLGNATTSSGGGAMYINGGTATIASATFFGNMAAGYGGAIHGAANALININDSWFTSNTSSNGSGGAIQLRTGAVLSATNANFIGNVAGATGGAIYGTDSYVALNVTSSGTSRFSGNTANSTANSIYMQRSGTLAVNVDVGGVLDMRDAMAAGGGGNSQTFQITKGGNGAWNLAGNNNITAGTGGTATFAVNAGALHLYRTDELGAGTVTTGNITLQGPTSTFSIANGAKLVVGGGNTISAGTSITFDSGSIITYDLANATPASSPLLTLTAGTLNLVSGAALNPALNFTSWTTGSFNLLTAGANTLNAINNTTSLNAILAGITYASGVTGPDSNYTITAGLNNDMLWINFLKNVLNNRVLTWKGNTSGNWSNANWKNATLSSIGFTQGDAINLDGSEVGNRTIAVDTTTSATVAGMYVSGNQSYQMTGRAIVTSTDAAVTTLSGSKVGTGKLILGARAADDGTDVLTIDPTTAFTGTLDLTGQGASVNNNFKNGVQINTGALRISSTGQLGTTLSKLAFTGTGALLVADNMTFDGGSGTSQHITIGTNVTATIAAEAGKTLTLANGNNLDPMSAGGGAITESSGATLVLANINFSGNAVATRGGAISTDQGVVITGTNLKFENNFAGYSGGAIDTLSSTVALTNARFVGNISGSMTGALYADQSVINLTGVLFASNTAKSAGAIYNNRGELYIQSGTFINNTASANNAGAIYNLAASATLTNVYFQGNSGGYGGAIRNMDTVLTGSASLTLANAIFVSNTARASGGAIANSIEHGLVTIQSSTFINNVASQYGGAIANDGLLNITNAVFINNMTGFDGGAIYSDGTTVLADISLINNKATSGFGGAIANEDGLLSIAITAGNSGTFTGNVDSRGANAIYASAFWLNAALDINVAATGTLDMSDPLSGDAGNGNTLAITSAGAGLWKLGGTSAFITDATPASAVVFTVASGTLELTKDAAIKMTSLGASNASSFALGQTAASETLVLDGNNTIAAPSGNIALNNGSIMTFASASGAGDMLSLTGTTSIDGVMFDTRINVGGSILWDQIAVTGTVDFLTNSSTFNITTTGALTSGTYALLTSTEGINYNGLTLGLAGITATGRMNAALDQTASQLNLVVNITNKVLTWTNLANNNIWSTSATNWNYTTPVSTDDSYYAGDYATFTSATRGTISVDSAGVKVAGMAVTGGTYAFTGGIIASTTVTTLTAATATTQKLDISGNANVTLNVETNFAKGATLANGIITLGNDKALGVYATNTDNIADSAGQLTVNGSGTIAVLANTNRTISNRFDVSNAGDSLTFALAASSTLTIQNIATGTYADGAIFAGTNSVLNLVAANGAQYVFSNNTTEKHWAAEWGTPGADTSGVGGAAIHNDGILTTANALFANNSAMNINGSGGAIYNSGIMSGTNLVFTSNTSSIAGALMNDSGTTTLTNVTFLNNSATRSAGAIYNANGILAIQSGTFIGNTAVINAGAVYNYGSGTTTITNALFANNSSIENAGAIYNNGANSLVIITSATFTGNMADSGGAIMNNGTMSITNALLSGNIAYSDGGAIFNMRNLILTDVNITNNQATTDLGGAIYNYGGNININVTAGGTNTFTGNTDGTGASSIYNFAYNAHPVAININVGANGVLDMQDPMSGMAGANSLAITSTGAGLWKLGGANTFLSTGGTNIFAVTTGTLQLANSASVGLAGANSTFTLGAASAPATLVLGGHNSLAADAGSIAINNASTIRFSSAAAGDTLALTTPSLTIDGATIYSRIDALANDIIANVNTGTAAFIGASSTIAISLSNWAGDHVYNLLTSGTVTYAASPTFALTDYTLNSRQSAALLKTGTALQLSLTGSNNLNLVWNDLTAGVKTWANTGSNWLNLADSGSIAMIANDAVTFGSVGTGTVNVTQAQFVSSMTVAGNYTFTGQAITSSTTVKNPGSGTTAPVNLTKNLTIVANTAATFANAIDFENGMTIAATSTATLADSGSFANRMAIANSGALVIDRTTNYALTSMLTGAGNTIKLNTGTLTLANYYATTGTLLQNVGAVNLSGTWNGAYNQAVASGLFVTANNACINGNATISGTFAPTGTLAIGGAATLNNATELLDLTAPVRIAVTGNATLVGTNTLALTTWANGTNTILTAASIAGTPANTAVTYAGVNLTTLINTRYSATTNILNTSTLQLITSNTNNVILTWTGSTDSTWASTNWTNGGTGAFLANTFLNNDTIIFDNTGKAASPVTLATTATIANITVNGTANYTYTGAGALAVTGTLGLNTTGTTTLASTGINTVAKGIYLNSGALALNNATLSGTVNAAAGTNLLGSGTIIGNVTTVGSNTITIGMTHGAPIVTSTLAITGTLTLANNTTIRFDNVATGTNDLLSVGTLNRIASGTSTIDLSTVQTGTYKLIATGNTLATTNTTNLLTTVNSSTLTGRTIVSYFTQGSDLWLTLYSQNLGYGFVIWDGTNSSTPSVWKEGVDNWQSSDRRFINGDSVIFDDSVHGTRSITVNDPLRAADMTINGTGNYTFTGTGSITTSTLGTTLTTGITGRLVMNSTGTTILANTGTNSFTGGIAINAGLLQGNVISLGTSAAGITNNATLDIDQAIDATYGVAIIGTGSLVKTSTGALILTNAANTYAGGVNVAAGTLELQNSGTATQGTLNIATGALFRVTSGPAYTVQNALTGSGTLSIALNTPASVFLLTAASGTNYTGVIKLSQSAFLLSNAANTAVRKATLDLGAGNTTTVDTGTQTIGNLLINGAKLNFSTTIPSDTAAAGVITTTTLALNTGTVQVSIPAGGLTNPASTLAGNLLAQDDGTTLTRLINATSVTGNANNLTLIDQNNNAIGNSTAQSIAITEGGTQVATGTYNYGLTATAGLAVSYKLTTIDILTGQTLHLAPDSGANAAASDLSANITGAGNLSIAASTGASHSVSLSGTGNTFTGTTTLTTGTLVINANGALGTSGTNTLVMSGSTGLNLNGDAQKLSTLTTDRYGTIQLNSGTLAITGALTTGDVTKITTGTNGVITTGAYITGTSGTMTLAAGATFTTATLATGAKSNININGGAFTVTAGGTSNGILSGPGTFTVTGGNLVVNGTVNSNLSAATNIAASSTITTGNANSLGSASVTLQAPTSTLVVNNNLSSGTNAILTNTIAGAGNVAFTGTGVTTINNANTGFTGNVAINSSDVVAANTAALGVNTNITIASSGTLDYIASGTIATNVTGAGNLNFNGNNAVVTGSNTIANINVINGASINAVATNALGNASTNLLVNSGTVILAKNNMILGNVTLAGTGYFGFLNDGNFRHANLQSFSSTGSNAQIVFHSDIARGLNDNITLANTPTGSNNITVLNSGAAPATETVTLTFISAPAGDFYNFALTSSTVDAGLYTYNATILPEQSGVMIQFGNTNNFNDAGKLIVGAAGAMPLTWFTELETLSQRLGDLILSNRTKPSMELWMRAYAQRLNVNTHVGGATFSEDQYGTEVGMDFGGKQTSGNALYLGAFIGYGGTGRNVSSVGSNGHTDSAYAGIYFTMLTPDGWYLDAVAKYNNFKNNFDARVAPATVSGHYTNNAIGGSIEGGRRIALKNNWYVQPLVQAASTQISSANYDTTGLAIPYSVKLGSGNTTQIRAGVQGGITILSKDGRAMQPYVKLYGGNQWSSGGDVTVLSDTDSYNPQIKGSRIDAGLGMNLILTKGLQMYIDYEYTWAKDYTKPYGVSFGANYVW